ncbi:MAG: flagellar hook assembly protein FlgD [Gammaproteobacteria bacterium]|nr:MAG: flagellar hook assembly protein FlgD [Gammaproteobacteria bacterium]
MIDRIDTQSLSEIGLRTVEQAQQKSQDRNKLGQEQFLKLMVAQLRNQDPLKPMQNGDFLAQMAQFGTVSGIGDLQKSFAKLSESLVSNQALQAAALVGHQVMAATGSAVLEDQGGVRGIVQLPESTRELVVNITDENGRLVRRLELGTQAAGEVHFQWDGFGDDGKRATPGTYHFSAEARIGDHAEAVETLTTGRVDAVTLGKGGIVVDLAGIGEIDFGKIHRIL